MTTIATRKEAESKDPGMDSSLALTRCADKVSLISDLFLSDICDPENFVNHEAAAQGVFWILQDIEEDLRFLEENFNLVKTEKKPDPEPKGKEERNERNTDL